MGRKSKKQIEQDKRDEERTLRLRALEKCRTGDVIIDRDGRELLIIASWFTNEWNFSIYHPYYDMIETWSPIRLMWRDYRVKPKDNLT